MICPEELVALVSALSVAIAKDLSINQLDILSAVLVQLGDTLATIAIQRNLIEECNENNEINNEIDEEIII